MNKPGSLEWMAEMAQNGASAGPGCGKMCGDCAFKLNQPHTTDFLMAAELAVSALAWEGSFNCHTLDHQDAGKPCVGFLYARQYLQTI